MTADAIAQVVADLREGRIMALPGNDKPTSEAAHRAAIQACAATSLIVDATAIYRDLIAPGDPIDVYEDHILVPPAADFAIAYENNHGNVLVLLACTIDVTKDDETRIPGWLSHAVATNTNPPGWRNHLVGDVNGRDIPEDMNGNHEINWAAIRWCVPMLAFAGGRSRGEACPTQGPSCMWVLLATGDGHLEDVHWMMLTNDLEPADVNLAGLVALGAINLLACTNVTAEEPARPRAERRRLARLGVTLKVLTVKPHRKATRGRSASLSADSTRLTSVRGHFAHYGACCSTHEPRGKLFGKLTGRYYIPQHARGNADLGEIRKTYELETS